VKPEEAVRRLGDATGGHFELLELLAGGETGATAIRDDRGITLVMKLETDRRNFRARIESLDHARHLGELGWPLPTQHAFDLGEVLIVLQELMPGRPVLQVTPAIWATIRDLHASRLGVCEPGEATQWAEEFVTTLTVGGHGYCLHEPLHQHSTRTRWVAERLEALGRSLSTSDLIRGDLLHGDLHNQNLLHDRDQLTAVIDADYARPGDASFDLVMFAVSAIQFGLDELLERELREFCLDSLDEPRRTAYVGQVVLRSLDWAIRKSREHEIYHWLGVAESVFS
jgi:hypothetical protein